MECKGIEVFNAETNTCESFLIKKGGFDLLLKLGDKPMRFGEIQTTLNLSPTTALERIREALKLGLIKGEVFAENGTKIKYVLTGGREVLEGTKPIQENYLKWREEIVQLERQKLRKEKELETFLFFALSRAK